MLVPMHLLIATLLCLATLLVLGWAATGHAAQRRAAPLRRARRRGRPRG